MGVNKYIYIQLYTYLDLQLALFSAHSSFCLDLRSFWLLCSLELEHAHLSWRTGINAFFPGIYACFPGKYANNFWLQNAQSAKMPKVVQLRSFGENRSKSINLSNEHLFVLFRGCRTNIIYTTYALFIDVIVHISLIVYLFIHSFIHFQEAYLFICLCIYLFLYSYLILSCCAEVFENDQPWSIGRIQWWRATCQDMFKQVDAKAPSDGFGIWK